MAIEVKGTDIIDDDRNIVGANTYNGYVPVNPTRAINSGNGIVGGGNLSVDRTLSIRAGDGLTANTTGIHIVAGNGLSVSSSNVYINEVYLNERYTNHKTLSNSALPFVASIGLPANTAVAMTYSHAQAGAPSDSPSIAQGAGIVIANPWREHQLHFDANFKVWHKSGTNVDEFWTTRNLPNPVNTATSIVAGNGLTGGGNLSTSRTLTVGAGDGISVLSTTVNVDNTVVRTSDTKNYTTTGSISASGITSTNGLTLSSGGFTVTGNSTLNGTLNVNNLITARNSLYVDATNTNIHMWFREASNNATRGVYYYDNANHALKMQLYAVDNTSIAISRTDLFADRFVSTVPFTGSGSGLTNLPATSLTGTIDDARLPTTAVRTSRTVTAGNGLTGGGNLGGNITLTVGDGDGITVNATNVAVDSTVVRTSRTVTAGNGLTGGGALSGNLTLTVGQGDGITVGSTTVSVDSTVARTNAAVPLNNNQLRIFESAGFNYIQSSNGTTADFKTLRITPLGSSAAKLEVSNTAVTAGSGVVFTGNGSGLTNIQAGSMTGVLGSDHLPSDVVYSARTVTAGNGLTGGGALSGNITLTVGKGDGITVNATNVAVDSTVVRTSRTVTAGNGLTGGGNLGGNITLTVGDGDGITVGTTSISVDSTVVRSSDNKNYTTTGSISSDGGNFIARSANGSSYLWFKDSSNNANRAVFYYNRNNNLTGQIYSLSNTSVIASYFILEEDKFTSSVPFSGSGSMLTNLPATSLEGTIADARLPSTAVRTSRTVTAGNGLTGGGALSGNVTLAVGAGNGISVGTTSIAVNAGNGLVANASGVHVQTGNGMTQNSTHVYVVAGDGITATSTGVAVDSTVMRNNTSQALNNPSGDIYITAQSRSKTAYQLIGTSSNLTYIRAWNSAGTANKDFTFDGASGALNATSFDGIGTNLTNLNANNLDRGSVPEARLGNVRNVIADYSAGSVGSYAILRINSGDVNPGQTIGGAQLTYTSTSGDANGGTPAGTWRLMGRVYSSSAGDRTSLWLRIS